MVKFKKTVVQILFYLFRVCPINNRKIVVSNYAGRGYSGEGKVIIDKLLSCGVECDVVWLCEDMNEPMPKGVRAVKYLSIQSIYHQVTAKIWIDNRRKAGYVRKRKGQYYIQTWHGDVCIKYVENDARETLSDTYLYNAKNDSKMIDLLVSGCEWRTKNYRDAFWYDGEILRGNLYKQFEPSSNNPQSNNRVRESLGIDNDVHLLLYAPTFRNDHRLSCYNIDYERLHSELVKKFGGKWCIVVRLHPNIVQLNDQISYGDYIKNGSLYPQINDLLWESDILISDYSGVIFEGFRYQKLVILYASDYEQYLQEDRKMYFDFEKLPSPMAKNNDQLTEIIQRYDNERYEAERSEFVKQFGYYDEDGAAKVADRIVQVMNS